MLIDWFTVGAQALNFVILVWLLKRFLYKPILNAVDAREKRIAAELADADAQKADARKERDEFQRKNHEFDEQRALLLSKATADAQVERQRLIEEARRAADALGAKRQEALRGDASAFHQAIRRQAQQEVFAITRRVLTDLAAASLEDRISEVFVRRLRSMESNAKESLSAALKTTSEPVLIRSAFELPEAQRANIHEALKETLSTDVQLRFETAPDLVSGVELITHGQKLSWSISDYLSSLERGVEALLEEREKPVPTPASKQP
jgi:F-type H+-transporting ATPase subunit b